jgi:hypothetical protein
MFTQDQIAELLKYIEFQHVVYIGDNVGSSVLTSADKALLKDYGIDPAKRYLKGVSKVEEAFYFGRLAAALGDKQAKTIKYNDFKKYVRDGGYRPLTAVESATLEQIKSRSYSHIKGLGQKVGKDVDNVVKEEEKRRRTKFEEIIRDESIKKIENRSSLKDMTLAIGHRTGDWERNLGRIVDTEMHDAMDEGRAVIYEKTGGKDVLVYKSVYDGACRHCIRLYLTGGIGSKPKTFKLSTLRANGSNIGRKVMEWKPVVGATHPHCRCTLHDVPAEYDWSDEDRAFTLPREYKRKSAVKRGTIKITVGDKVLTV